MHSVSVNQIADNHEQCSLYRLVVLEGDNSRLRNELSEERALHKYDVDKMKQGKEDEMDELHKRVKKAIANKVRVISMPR